MESLKFEVQSLNTEFQTPKFKLQKWWARWDLNPRPNDYESSALTTELQARRINNIEKKEVNALCNYKK